MTVPSDAMGTVAGAPIGTGGGMSGAGGGFAGKGFAGKGFGGKGFAEKGFAFEQSLELSPDAVVDDSAAAAAEDAGLAAKRQRPDVAMAEAAAGAAAGGAGAYSSSQPKRGRKLVKEQKVCKNCGTRNTPFWRKDKNDGRPLCNACGLYFAKNDMQRPKD
ncbi:hypothetical protein OEZ86_009201 [Tetradesmus obliquus]|nr:hypothetical protein OEZ86_009201 [Tetradesmus obliquus]